MIKKIVRVATRNIRRNAFMPFRVRWLLLLGLCATQTVFAEPHKTATPPKLRTLVNRDPCEYPKRYYCTELTDVKIGRYVLKVPHNLIGDWPPGSDFIELLPRWPGLRGSIKNEKYTVNFDPFDIIHILIHTERPQRPTESGIQELIRVRNLTESTALKKLGLLEYIESQKIKALDFPFSYYLPTNQVGLLPNNQPLFIQCTGGPYSRITGNVPDISRGGEDGTIQCHFGYTIRDGLYVTVRFFKRYIASWKPIIISTHNLVESFIQE